MKKLLVISILFVVFFSLKAQNMSYNKNYFGVNSDKQNLEATEMLYREVNVYRDRFDRSPLKIDPVLVNYSCRWTNYMVLRHKSDDDNFYQHSKYGPDSLQIKTPVAEICHYLYFDHYPSNVEIIQSLLYGSNVPLVHIVGWTESEGHNRILLMPDLKNYGVSIFVFKLGELWMVYSTINFSR